MPALDLTTRVARIGNPASTYATNNARDWNTNRYPRGVTDIQVFSARLYLGAGEWNYQNYGPMPFLSYDPAGSTGTGAIGGAGASASTALQEGFDRYVVVNGALVALGADGRGAADAKLSYYKLEGTSFVAYEATPVGGVLHGFDMVYWEGAYWYSADSAGVYRQTTLGSGGVGGVTWAFASGAPAFVWNRKLFTIGADLYTATSILTTGASGGTGNYLSKCPSGSTTFAAVSGTTYAFLAPGAPAAGNYPLSGPTQTSAQIHRTVNFPTSGTLVYTVAEEVTGYAPHDLCVWTPGTNPISKLSSLPSGFKPMDLVVDGSTLYVVGYYMVGPDTVGSLVSTTNLTTWTEVATFKPNLIGGTSQGQAVPRSAEILGKTLYIGLAGTNPTLTQPNNVGDLFALNLNWLTHVSQDWPMAGANAARTGFQATEVLGTAHTIAWRAQQQVDFAATTGVEKTHSHCGVLVTAGKALICTLMGKVRSYTAASTTKTLNWTATIGAPIVSTPCSDGTRAYVADVYGRVTAITLATGALAWGPIQITAGQWAPIRGALLYADSKVIVPGEDGTLYALNPSTGAVLWNCPLGGAIQQGAAWSNATGTGLCVVGAANMRVYAVNSATGVVVWTSGVLYGGAFKDYYPVIDTTRQKVLTRPMAKLPAWLAGSSDASLQTPYRAMEVTDWTSDAAMTAALQAYVDVAGVGYAKTLYVLSLVDGTETATDQVLHWQWSNTMHGANPPVVIDRSGYYVIPAQMATPLHAENFSHGWVRVNPATRKIVGGLYDSTLTLGASNPNGFGSRDENIVLSACSNSIAAVHHQAQNSHDTGVYDQDSGIWRLNLFGIGGSNVLYINTQGGGTNQPAISGGWLYHNTHPHTLHALRSS